jgi:hypothetical protein
MGNSIVEVGCKSSVFIRLNSNFRILVILHLLTRARICSNGKHASLSNDKLDSRSFKLQA